MDTATIQLIANVIVLPMFGAVIWVALQIMDLRVMLHRDFASKKDVAESAAVAHAIDNLAGVIETASGTGRGPRVHRSSN